MGGIASAIGSVVSSPFKAVGDLVTGHPIKALEAVPQGIANAGKDILSDPLSSAIIGGVGGFMLGGPIGAAIGAGIGGHVSQNYQTSQYVKQFQQTSSSNASSINQWLQSQGYSSTQLT